MFSHTDKEKFCFRELKLASGEWMNEIATQPPRRDSITNKLLPASDIIRKSIRRSWTITSKYKIEIRHLCFH